MKRHKLNWLLLGVFLVVATVSCQKRGSQKTPKQAKTTFEPITTDSKLDRDAVQGATLLSEKGVSILARDTSEYMGLVESLFELGDEVRSNDKLNDDNRRALQGAAHAMIKEFYASPKNYTKFGPLHTPFMDVTLGLEEANLQEFFGGFIDSSIPALNNVILNLPVNTFELIDDEDDFRESLIQNIGEIRRFVETLPNEIDRANKAAAETSGPQVRTEIVNGIRKEVSNPEKDDDYLDQIDQLEVNLQNVGPEQDFQQNLDDIVSAIDSFQMLQGTDTYESVRAQLQEAQTQYDETNVLLKFVFGGSAREQLLVELANAFNGILPQLPRITANAVLRALDLKKERDQARKELHGIAAAELIKRVFKDEETLPAVERGDIKLILSNGQKLKTSINRKEWFSEAKLKNSIPSGAAAVGTTMAAMARRLKSMEEFEKVSPYQDLPQQIVFSHINKMLRAVGHPGVDKRPHEAFFRSVDKERIAPLNIYGYGEQDGLYAMPSRIVIAEHPESLQDNFSLNLELTRRQGLPVRVGEQADLIRGASHMIRYFRTDEVTLFDFGLGRHRFGEGEDAISIFPKGSFFDMHVGIVAIPLRNFERGGLVVYDREYRPHSMTDIYNDKISVPVAERKPIGKKRFDETCEKKKGDETEASSAVMAALYDLLPETAGQKKEKIVRTKDISKMIVALDTFIDATRDEVNFGDRSKAFMYERITRANPNLYGLKCGRYLLRKLNMGLGIFITRKMQGADGGVNGQIDIEGDLPAMVSEKGRSLEDQIYALRALVRIYKEWGGRLFQFAASDIYHNLNKNFFDEGTGFYSAYEDVYEKPSLEMVVQTLLALTEFEKYALTEDRDQMRFLRQTWTKKLADSLRPLSEVSSN